MKTDKKTSRRQWLTGLLRGSLLAAFGGTSVHLLRRESGGEETDCADPKGHIGCRVCRELNNCKLPRALSVKQFLHGDNHDERKS
ncbi:MAG: hypothetical protein ISS71_05810 [Phycisphaerae bacterium]|nr:hypothetical protein [Phycisphaerae bacterium]